MKMQLTFSQTGETGHQPYAASVVNLENLKINIQNMIILVM